MQRHRSGGARSGGVRSGFTLVEVLVVLMILGGLMLAMTQILTAARLTRDSIHNIQETQLAGPTILDLIERDLRCLTVFNRPAEEHLQVRDRVLLGLDGDSLAFVSTNDSLVLHEDEDSNRFVRGNWNEVGYVVRPSPTEDDFLELYRREQFGVDEEPFVGGNYTFLHDRVKGFDIQVFIADGPDAEPVDEWGMGEGADESAFEDEEAEPASLPTRIEISLTLELAPRIVREQLRFAPVDRRTVTYKRIFRLSEGLRFGQGSIPAIGVPSRPEAPAQDLQNAQNPGGQGQPQGQGGRQPQGQGQGQGQGQRVFGDR